MKRQLREPIFELGNDQRYYTKKNVQLTHEAEGVKNSFVASAGVATLLRLVMLFVREKVGWPTGIFPLAFSDMPLT